MEKKKGEKDIILCLSLNKNKETRHKSGEGKGGRRETARRSRASETTLLDLPKLSSFPLYFFPFLIPYPEAGMFFWYRPRRASEECSVCTQPPYSYLLAVQQCTSHNQYYLHQASTSRYLLHGIYHPVLLSSFNLKSA